MDLKYIIVLFVIGILVLLVLLRKTSNKTVSKKRVKNIQLESTAKKENTAFSVKGTYDDLVNKFRVRQQTRLEASKTTKGNGKANETELMLRDAGIVMTSTTFWLLRFSFGGLFAVLIYILLSNVSIFESSDVLLLSMCGLIGGIVIPMFFIKSYKKKKNEKLVNSMADMMELLSISTSAGLGLDNAVLKIYEYNKSPAMVEMMYALTEVQHGVSKKKAYKAMAARNNCREMSNFVSAILQSEEMGIPISDVLRAQAELLRESRRMRAEEKAEKAPVKMMFPLVFCMFPAILVVLLAPAAINIFEMFSSGGLF